nr:retrovirus-related Pol polyprotein from transposon TNT 1-94 [Tanacetum cinerariifolium]
MTTPNVTSSIDSQMHNNIMAAGSRDRPPMLAPGRYPQWRSRFLRYVDKRPNDEALRKCILSSPYKPTTVLVQAVEATDDSPTVPKHMTVETPTNMSPENKAHFLAEKEAIHLILTGIRDDIYSTVDACQTTQEMWEAIERLQQASEEDNNPEQAQRDKDMQKNLALIAKYFKKIYKPTKNNLRTSSNSKSKNVDTTPRYKNDDHSGQFGTQRTLNVVAARENIGIKDVPLQAEQYDWLADTDEEVDEQELEAHYSYMAKIQEVPTVDSDTDSEPVEQTKQAEFEKYKAFNDRTIDYDKLEHIFRAPTAHDIEILIQTCLMPLAIKTQSDSLKFIHELKQEMHADLKYVESLEKEIDELESDKAEFLDMYDVILQECVSKDVMCSYLQSLSDLDILAELQCMYLHKVKECDCLAQRLSKQTESDCKKVHTELLQRFAKVEKYSISLEIALQNCKEQIVHIILFIVDSGYTKHITGNLKLFCKFVEKFLGIVRFGNDQFAPILSYGDLVQGNVTINRVYHVAGLNHNLFSVGQFCDADLEVAFRKSTCFVIDLQGNDLLTGNRGSDLYTISLQESTSSTPLCLMAKATPTQAWLWHRRLSHLNFDYINLLSKKDIVIGLPKLKYVKDQLCSSCELSKSKRSSFKSKAVPSSKGRLNLLHMDLYGPMRVASINRKKYILVIVDDYSRYTWTLFLRSKNETPEVLKEFLTMIQRNLQALVIIVCTDRGTEFLNKSLNAFFKEEGIEHQTSTTRIPEQNGVVKRRNRTLVEAARTMLSASQLPLFF